MKLTDEQLRGLANAGQMYEVWREVLIQLSKLPGGMYWRVINSREYLYQYAPTLAGTQQTKSLGPRSPSAEETYEDFKKTKHDLDERRAGVEKRIKEFAPAWRALRLPAIDRTAASVLRAFDQVDFVGNSVLVVGTYALKAYEVAAATSFSAGMDATEDLDFTLVVDERTADPDLPRRLLLTLKQVDSSFITNMASAKTVVNKNGYRIDLLTSKAAGNKLSSARPWKPEILEGQEWLLMGQPVSVVLIDFDGWPVALAAPDPRYFALHKMWLSRRRDRPAIKRAKDSRQAEALLETIKEHMLEYPLDTNFESHLPAPLRQEFAAYFTRSPGPRARGPTGKL
jgi:hypothetical protein